METPLDVMPLQLIPSPGIPTFFGETFNVGMPDAANAGMLEVLKTSTSVNKAAKTHANVGIEIKGDVMGEDVRLLF